MAIAASARIHPTALISQDAQVGENVEIGAYAIVDGPVTIGPDCVLKHHAQVCGHVTMGRGNQVFSGAILGESPQHLKYQSEPTRLEIGDDNIFRENVTIHRGTTHSHVTRIGNKNFFMAGSHVAHDSVVGNHCILANNALVAGHCVLEDSVNMSGNTAVHQFCRIGRLAFLGGCSATTKDIPPFITQQGINNITGLNLVGLRRAGMTPTQIQAIRHAYKVLFRQGLVLSSAMAKLERDLGEVDVIQELLTFLRKCTKGINLARSRLDAEAA